MTFRIKIQEVNIEEIRNGRNKYDKATVVYSFNGENRTQKLMSFSNPAVFAKVKAFKSGDEVVVTVTKDDKGYNQWASVEPAGADIKTDGGPVKGTTSTRSSYETPEERAQRQLMIVRQSSISSAIAMLTPGVKEGETIGVTDVLEVAQEFVDFVYGDTQALDGEDPSVSE